jgi:hypothetical protein
VLTSFSGTLSLAIAIAAQTITATTFIPILFTLPSKGHLQTGYLERMRRSLTDYEISFRNG